MFSLYFVSKIVQYLKQQETVGDDLLGFNVNHSCCIYDSPTDVNILELYPIFYLHKMILGLSNLSPISRGIYT